MEMIVPPIAPCYEPLASKMKTFEKPQVAVCSAWSMVTPCNSHLDELGKASVEGVDQAGGKAVPFGTITVSDGISMGTPGMRYSLVSAR